MRFPRYVHLDLSKSHDSAGLILHAQLGPDVWTQVHMASGPLEAAVPAQA